MARTDRAGFNGSSFRERRRKIGESHVAYASVSLRMRMHRTIINASVCTRRRVHAHCYIVCVRSSYRDYIRVRVN